MSTTAPEAHSNTRCDYRARYYDPAVARFISEDPIGFDGGDNFYGYTANNPILYTDSMGLAPCLDIDKFVSWLDAHAHRRSQHECAKYVRMGLQAGGLDTRGHPGLAKDYGPFLERLGFAEVSPDNYSPQKGDIVLIQSGPSPAGHIEAWDGKTWVSDFKQNANRISPYQQTSPYAIYKTKNPCPGTAAPGATLRPVQNWLQRLANFLALSGGDTYITP